MEAARGQESLWIEKTKAQANNQHWCSRLKVLCLLWIHDRSDQVRLRPSDLHELRPVPCQGRCLQQTSEMPNVPQGSQVTRRSNWWRQQKWILILGEQRSFQIQPLQIWWSQTLWQSQAKWPPCHYWGPDRSQVPREPLPSVSKAVARARKVDAQGPARFQEASGDIGIDRYWLANRSKLPVLKQREADGVEA